MPTAIVHPLIRLMVSLGASSGGADPAAPPGRPARATRCGLLDDLPRHREIVTAMPEDGIAIEPLGRLVHRLELVGQRGELLVDPGQCVLERVAQLMDLVHGLVIDFAFQDGIELGVNGNITDKWAVSAGYTYLDSELVDDGPKESNEGNQVQNVAKNSATLWTTYQILPQLQIGAGTAAMDKVYGNAANTKYVPGYVRYDAMARYNVNKNVDLQLNVNNLSDERYFTKAYASHYATEAEGRSAVLSVNFKY